MLPSLQLEVTFRNTSAPRLGEVVLMRGGVVLSSRAQFNHYKSHLVIKAVTEADEGIYTVKNPDKPEDVRRKVLVVRGTPRIQNFHFKRENLSYILTTCPSKNLTNFSVNEVKRPTAGDRPHVVC